PQHDALQKKKKKKEKRKKRKEKREKNGSEDPPLQGKEKAGGRTKVPALQVQLMAFADGGVARRERRNCRGNAPSRRAVAGTSRETIGDARKSPATKRKLTCRPKKRSKNRPAGNMKRNAKPRPRAGKRLANNMALREPPAREDRYAARAPKKGRGRSHGRYPTFLATR